MNATIPSADLRHPPAMALAERYTQTVTLILLWAFLSIASGYRWLGIGPDFLQYLGYYNNINFDLSVVYTRFEPGFHYTAWFFRNVLDVEIEIFGTALVALSLGIKFYLFRKYLTYPVLAVIAYIMIFYPLHEYTQIRVAAALAFSYLAVHLCFERRYLLAIVLFWLGYTFHTSTLLLPLAYFGGRFLRGNFALLVIALGAAVLIILSGPLTNIMVSVFEEANPLLRNYSLNVAMESASILSVHNLLLIGSLASAIAFGWIKKSEYHRVFLIMSIASLVIIAAFSGAPVIAQRTKEVLFVSTVFLMHRSRFSLASIPPVVLFWMNALLLGYLAVREQVVFV